MAVPDGWPENKSGAADRLVSVLSPGRVAFPPAIVLLAGLTARCVGVVRFRKKMNECKSTRVIL